MIVPLCERFGQLPEALLAQDVSFLRMVNLYDAEHREVDDDG